MSENLRGEMFSPANTLDAWKHSKMFHQKGEFTINHWLQIFGSLPSPVPVMMHASLLDF